MEKDVSDSIARTARDWKIEKCIFKLLFISTAFKVEPGSPDARRLSNFELPS
jgi:hypothetical protein